MMSKSVLLFLVFIEIIIYPTFAFGQNYNVILGRPTDKSITASILFDSESVFYIQYGTQPDDLDKRSAIIEAQKDIPVRVELTYLQPNTKYHYVLVYKKLQETTYNTSQNYQFQTQRAKGTSFTVTIEADEHLYDKKGIRSLYEICLDNQLKDNPDFMFSLGDTFGDDHTPNTTTSLDMKQLHKDYIPLLSKVCHSAPFFFCLGNHEGENGYYLKQNDGENICVYGTQWRKYYFPNPYPNGFYSGNMKMEGFGIGLPENYYAFEWGDAHFIVLDVYRHCDESEKPQKWNWTLGENQYIWFKKTLETSNSKYKFVFAHHTRGQGRGGIGTARAYEWGGYNGDNGSIYEFDNYRPGWGLPIHALMVKHGVNVYFQGHDHLFAKEDLDGIVYQEVPMPSDSTYEIGVLANADAYKGVTLRGSGHIKLHVSPECIKVDFVRAYLPKDTLNSASKNREIAYSYTVGNCTSSNEEAMNDRHLEVFPNPSDQAIQVRYLGDLSAMASIELLDVSSRTLMSTEYNANYAIKTIETSTIPNGIYFIRLRHPETIITKKVVIHH